MAKAPSTTPAAPVDKAKKFSELASARLTKAVDAVELLANLSNKTSYDYTPEQVSKILGHLNAATKHVEQAFASGGIKKSGGITL